MSDEVPEAELVAKIKAIIDGKPDAKVISLDHHDFDRLPCTRRRLLAVCRKYAASWGFTYDKSEYVPSGNRAFQKNHKRGYMTGSWLSKVKG